MPLPRPGTTILSPRGPRYILGGKLGEGAFGAVFEAVGPFDQRFAVKVCRPPQGKSLAEVQADWQREAARLFALRHPNIVYVHEHFPLADWLHCFVLERCDHTLEDMLGVPFTDRLVVDLTRQILFALQYLHDSEVVHNDLHAGNVLIQQTDPLTVKLSDLGIALELRGLGAVRPPVVHHRIMAPEVAAGGYTTKQSDLYQLGLLVYAMHTGAYPIDFEVGYEGILEQIRNGVPRARAEALGTPLGNIASGMLRRHEQYRYTSPQQVWDDLRRLDVWTRDARETP